MTKLFIAEIIAGFFEIYLNLRQISLATHGICTLIFAIMQALNKHISNYLSDVSIPKGTNARLCAWILVVFFVPLATQGQSWKPRAWINGGVFLPQVDSSVRLDSQESGMGTTIDLEDDLGMSKSETMVSVNAGLYFSKRFRVESEYFDLERSGLRRINEEIVWGDEIFQAGADLLSRFDVQMVRVGFGYDIYQRDNWGLGFTLGAHLLDSSVGIDAEAVIENTRASISEDASTESIFPLPNVGFYGYYLLNERWFLVGRIGFFDITIGEWGGELITTELAIHYRLTKRFSAGAAFEYFQLQADYEDDTWKGMMEFKYFGPKIYLSLHF